MNEKNTSSAPYEHLGKALKRMRLKRHASLAEVSGAVEIDVDALGTIESGKQRPSEDILLLLISYFAVKEDEATKLWELAGYDNGKLPDQHLANDNDGSIKPTVMVMPMDARIVYTDMVHVVVNNYGVVMNFMQSGGPNDQPMAVSRIGMSKEHAQSILEVLHKTLNQQQKSLPPSSKKKDSQQ